MEAKPQLEQSMQEQQIRAALELVPRKAGWHPLLLNRERVQDSYSDPISLVRESVIVPVQGTAELG